MVAYYAIWEKFLSISFSFSFSFFFPLEKVEWSWVEVKWSFWKRERGFWSEVHLTPKSAAKTRNEHARSRSVGNNDEIGNTNVIIVGGGKVEPPITDHDPITNM